MALQANCLYRNACFLQTFDQIDGSLELGFILERVIVVIEFSVRISLMGKLEGFRDKVLSDDLEPR